ncbi:MAG: hypothetical protein R3286_19950 [Gammaproteobacteria bacterium]|nr:hypothetical protein [Gammaproteobacteria bacterium]
MPAATRLTAQAVAMAMAGLLLLASCAHMEAQDQAKKLEAAVRNYVLAVRWGNYGAAVRYLRGRDGEMPKPDLDALEGIKVTQYDYAIDAAAPGATEARMTAAFEYYYVDTRVVRKTYQQSLWWWDTDHQVWFMEGNLPDFPRK